MSLRKSGVVLLLLATKLALGSDALVEATDSCGPSTKWYGSLGTTTRTQDGTPTVDYITWDFITTVPHSCYTHVVETPWTPTDIATTTKRCGVQAQCIMQVLETVYVPPHDPCCKTTMTVSTPSASPTCQKGCQMKTMGTTTITTNAVPLPANTYGSNFPSSLLPNLVSLDGRAVTPTAPALVAESTAAAAAPNCTHTWKEMAPMHLGPVKTVYKNVIVSSVTISGCAGCDVVTRNMAGIGPVAIFTTTYTETVPTTTTSYVCGPSSMASV